MSAKPREKMQWTRRLPFSVLLAKEKLQVSMHLNGFVQVKGTNLSVPATAEWMATSCWGGGEGSPAVTDPKLGDRTSRWNSLWIDKGKASALGGESRQMLGRDREDCPSATLPDGRSHLDQRNCSRDC